MRTVFVKCFRWLCALTTLGCLAQDWPQWRGPERDGSAPAFRAPAVWPTQLKKIWSVETGLGYSSPVAARQRVYILTGKENREQVSCLDIGDGHVLWQHAYDIEFKANPYAERFGKGPFATPAIAGGKLYTLGITGKVSCWDAATGEILWRHQFEGELSDTRHFFCGNTASPLILGDLCIVSLGNEHKGRMVAYDRHGGTKKWSWDGDIPGYASPILATFDGKKQIVTLTQRHVVGLDPQDGHLLWKLPFESEWRENIVTPVQFEQTLIVSGVGRSTRALLVKRDRGRWTVAPKWMNEEALMYMSTPIIEDGRLFGLFHSRKGQFFCMDAASGKILWTSEGREGQNAAILKTDTILVGLSTEGRLVFFSKSADRFEPLKTYHVADSETWAQPILLERNILIKDRTHLTSWSLSP